LHEWRRIDWDFAVKLRFEHKSMDNSDTVEGMEDDVFLQGEHDGHMTFSVNQILFYWYFCIYEVK
jgi:hypothetical protein